MMYIKNVRTKTGRILFSLLLGMLLSAASLFAHGGKTHKEPFTALQALIKATTLYDKLIGSAKLAQSWETNLAKVEVSRRERNGKTEIVVVFHRLEDTPKSVYIFFDVDGKYTGSNFTGK